jgi:hypothetical protein
MAQRTQRRIKREFPKRDQTFLHFDFSIFGLGVLCVLCGERF